MKLERPKWPENKKCSAMITINLNAELFWLQLDPTCKDMPKTLSLGQYGMTRGVDRILKILEERGIRATFFTPGWVAEQYPDKLKAIVEKGHEIAALGYHHEHMALLSDAMNTASVMSFSWIRQPSEHRAGSDFWKSFWIILKPLMVYGGQPVRKCMTTA